MERRSWRIVTSVALLGIVLLAGCDKPEIGSVGPADPQAARKLRLSEQEWQEIQSEFRTHRGDLIARELKVLWWGRSAASGLVEVGCVDPSSPSSGPVYFFRRDDGHWRILREVSVWDEGKRQYRKPRAAPPRASSSQRDAGRYLATTAQPLRAVI